MGKKVQEFEDLVTQYTSKYALAMNNGTSTAFNADILDIGVDETNIGWLYLSSKCYYVSGRKPILSDSDPKTFNVNPENIKKKNYF